MEGADRIKINIHKLMPIMMNNERLCCRARLNQRATLAFYMAYMKRQTVSRTWHNMHFILFFNHTPHLIALYSASP